ncbi:iron transporter FeoA [Fervidobacterium thailandense]|uniref:Iron transporter FeoA n=1 Tax=Fervidobacterium thailandense TaxID=1008305 RepID=A0A1E3G0T5_9BACT|nr:iron transporter FeoA [Fervidobacterium thailandense]
MKLSDVPENVTVDVIGLEESEITPRLRAVGILPGVRLEVLKSAPLGDPRMYRVFNKVISLRNSEASLVRVKISDDSPLPLLNVPPGDYVVVRIDGGWMLRSRLAAIGIVEGSAITLLPDGKIKTAAGEFDIGFGRMAKVFVKKVR